jgi:signal transduction histidine kinase
MNAQEIEKIFVPFYTTKAVGEGTGLGLAIALGIIEEHNGRIQVISEPGKGTEFILHLPRHMKRETRHAA